MLVFSVIYTFWDNSVSRLGHGLYDRGVMVQVLAVVSGISLLHCIQTTSRAHPALYAEGLWALSLGLCSQGMKLPIHLHVMPRLRMYGTLNSTPSICLHGVHRHSSAAYLFV